MKNKQFLYFGGLIAGLFLFKRLIKKPVRIKDITNSLPKDGAWSYRPIDGITDITLHHTASGPDWTPERLAKLHIKDRHWPGIAYHFLVYENGDIFQTNKLESKTYHNGYNNTKAIGVSMVGNYETSYPTKKQIDSVEYLCKKLRKENKGIIRLVGHKENPGASTVCPGGNVNMSTFRDLCGLNGPGGKLVSNTVMQLSNINRYNPNEADN